MVLEKALLLGLIAGVLYPQSGSATANTSRIGYIGAVPLILTDFIRANVLYGNKLERLYEKILNLLKSFELFDDENRYDLDLQISNKSLSSGQMQKIAFVRALLEQKLNCCCSMNQQQILMIKSRNKI